MALVALKACEVAWTAGWILGRRRALLRDLLATPADERPAVSFLSATNWNNPVHDLIGALAPRFAERPGGYTRILRVGYRRGDSAEVGRGYRDDRTSYRGEGASARRCQ